MIFFIKIYYKYIIKMLSELFIIINILSKFIAAQESYIDSGSAVWIYNKSINKCLYTVDFLDEPIYYTRCDNTENGKWYIDSVEDGIYIKAATDTSLCMTYIDNKIKLDECNENSILYYDEVLQFIKFNGKCLNIITDKNNSVNDSNLNLENCKRKNENMIWEISNVIPTKKTSTTTTTTKITTKPTPTITSVWIYNEYTNNCLYAPDFENESPTYKTCENSDDFQWYVMNTTGGSYFKSKNKQDLCIRVSDNDNTKLLMGECDDNAILRYHKGDKTIVSKFSEDLCLGNPNNESSKLKRKAKLYDCSEEIYDDQLWSLTSSYPIKKTTTIKTITHTKTSIATPIEYSVWIYNEHTNNCLYAPEYDNEIPTYEKCYDSDDYQWYVINTTGGSYFKSKTNSNLCIRVSDKDRSKLLMGECDDNAILRYRKNDKTIVSKLSNNLCLGKSEASTSKRIKLYDCEEGANEDQIWILTSSYPIKKTITTTISTTITKSPSPTIDTKYRCGKDFNNKSCSKGECCSKYGYCGTSIDHCGTGCQASYGRCNDGGRCGTDYGKCLNEKQCCSQHGYCDISDAHCGSKCQSEFGLCYGSHDKCGEQYGRCKGNKCCSKWGYCGTSNDHCKKGCQPKYGLCK